MYLNINFTIVIYMPLDDKTKDEIIKSFNSFSIVQEHKILEKMRKCSFTEEEIENIIKTNIKEDISLEQKNRTINYLLNTFSPSVSRFYYEGIDDRSGIESKKIREIDFRFNFNIFKKLETSVINSQIFFAGDIKNNDEYLWVFSSIKENFGFFPIYFENADNEQLLKHFPIIWNKKLPLPFTVVENMIPLHKNGKRIAKKEKKKEQRPRDFCNQVTSGIDGLILTIQRYANIGGINTKNLIVPLLILSNKPILISKIPPRKEDVKETEALIYLFQPNFTPTTTSRWLIPILVVHQDSLLDVIKKLTVIFTIELI